MVQNLSALFAVVAALSFTACQKNAGTMYNNADSAQIIGGEVVQPSDIVVNSTVALKYIQGNNAYAMCTGTLISPNLVLTAAHCLRGQSKSQIRIGFSINVINKLDPETMVEVADMVIHPKYGSTGRLNDVALIALAKTAPAPYKPVGIISDKYKMEIGMPMLLAGYGVINDANGEDTEALRKVTVPMAKIIDADAILVTDQTKNTGACNGDSGGPAYLEKDGLLYVYGITRGPHANAPHCHAYGEYTWASKFETFILESAAKMKTETPSFVLPQ